MDQIYVFWSTFYRAVGSDKSRLHEPPYLPLDKASSNHWSITLITYLEFIPTPECWMQVVTNLSSQTKESLYGYSNKIMNKYIKYSDNESISLKWMK